MPEEIEVVEEKEEARAFVKEFYANLGDHKNLTCYVRGRWIPFGEKAISQLLELKPGGDCAKYDQLEESSKFEEIVKELTNGLGQWQRTKTIHNAYIDKGDLIQANKVWFYLSIMLSPPRSMSQQLDKTVPYSCMHWSRGGVLM